MDLWIRSQNKLNLIKVNNSINIVRGEDFYIATNYRELENGQESWDLLGKYATKERALEVLDDIQNNVLTFNFSYENMSYEEMDLRLKALQTTNILKIYQMPKE